MRNGDWVHGDWLVTQVHSLLIKIFRLNENNHEYKYNQNVIYSLNLFFVYKCKWNPTIIQSILALTHFLLMHLEIIYFVVLLY